MTGPLHWKQFQEQQDTFFEECNSTSKPIVSLLNYIVENYFGDCFTILLYDDYFYHNRERLEIINELLISSPKSVTHGRIIMTNAKHYSAGKTLALTEVKCQSYIMFTKDIESGLDIIGTQVESKVVLITQVSQWQIDTFLAGNAYKINKLLIITDPSLQIEEFIVKRKSTIDIIMYTQNLYTDSLGSSTIKVVTAWRCDHLTQPHVNLFSEKLNSGFNGFRFRLASAQQPPYIYRKRNQMTSGRLEDRITTWDGNEIRLLRFIGEILNFTLVIKESADSLSNDGAQRVLQDLLENKADMAAAGIPLTASRLSNFTFSSVHSYDCVNFVLLTSTAIPKYRAILGPFRLEVWVTIIIIYMFGILPISLSAKHTLKHLLNDPREIENMFWYVFGTFTNCFTFTGKGSWTSGNMNATRIFIGIYWVFTIIITAAYTGCIIAFITLPAYPPVLNTAEELLKNNYKIGILRGTEWQSSFENSSDLVAIRLLKQADFVPSMEIGLRNVTRSMFRRRPYAFLGSREELKYVIKTNFTPSSRHKKSKFHLSKDCFVPLFLSIVFPKNVLFSKKIDETMMRLAEGGFLSKLSKDVEWDQYRMSTGKLLQVSSSSLKLGAPEDRQLTLDDTQGMFLLLGTGFLGAFIILLGECGNKIYTKFKKNHKEINKESRNPSITVTSHNGLTSYFGSKISTYNSTSNEQFYQYAGHKISLSLMDFQNKIQNSIRRYSH